MTHRFVVILSACISISALASDTLTTADWPQWRGPHRDGISEESNWSVTWPKDGPKIAWTAKLGIGYATVAISHGHLFTMGNDNGEDTVWSLDALTGKEIWHYSYKCDLEPNSHAGGPGSTPAVDGNFVYTMSKFSQIHCIDATTGKVKWAKNAMTDFGAKKPQWSFSSSPLIVGDTLLLNCFSSGLALNKNTGELLWKGIGVSGYASPVVFKIKDGLGAAFFGRDSLTGVNISNGKELWEIPWKTSWGENTPDPIVSDDLLYVSSGHGLGAALFKLSEDVKPASVWENKKLGNHISSAVLKDGNLYGFSGLVHRKPSDEKPNTLSCVDFKTGKSKWIKSDMLGQLTLAGDKLIIVTIDGELVVAGASPEKYVELARAKVLESKNGEGKNPPKKSWTVPVLSNGRIYCRNALGDLVCIDVSK